MNTDQIAAEALTQFEEAVETDGPPLDSFERGQFLEAVKSAVEKATEPLEREIADKIRRLEDITNQAAKLSRAAHATKELQGEIIEMKAARQLTSRAAHSLPAEVRASEQGAVDKLIEAVEMHLEEDSSQSDRQLREALAEVIASKHGTKSQRATPATASEQAAWDALQKICGLTDIREIHLTADVALSQSPIKDSPSGRTPATASETREDRFTRKMFGFSKPRKPDSATASENCHLCDQGFPINASGYHYGTQRLGMIANTPCKLRDVGKPDSDSAGKEHDCHPTFSHEILQAIENDEDVRLDGREWTCPVCGKTWIYREGRGAFWSAATPSGGGKWTETELGIDIGTEIIGWNDPTPMTRLMHAHNQSLQPSLPAAAGDCGADTKRLDWLQDCISNGRDVPNVDPLSDNSLREAIDAAMSETGRGEKSQT